MALKASEVRRERHAAKSFFAAISCRRTPQRVVDLAIPEGVPAVPEGVPAGPDGVPAVSGVPAVPDGVLAVPDGIRRDCTLRDIGTRPDCRKITV
jgi:hypothetical protein